MHNGRFVIITGLSGAGKSEAVRAFEDLGFFCVDNIPPTLIPKFAELAAQSEGKIDKIALVVDIRSREFFDRLFSTLDELEIMGVEYEILFLEASDETLVRRFKETRRRHPLSAEGGIIEGISEERRKLEEVRRKASRTIDTSSITPKQLRERIKTGFVKLSSKKGIDVIVVSFGFKYGIPIDADLIFDVRFLPNPYYVESLRPLTGESEAVEEYVLRSRVANSFINKLYDFMVFLLPQYLKEGKAQLIVGIGCTGGRHRSVAIANRLADFLKNRGYNTTMEHRDMDTPERLIE
ncbi:MAG: RNase adapter RapZ [Firmicutes bacterium]|nr:RNase adapter RapZ [Bacillota bacterium]